MSVHTSRKKSLAQLLRTIWVPLVVGIVMLAMLGIIGGLVWRDYRTALMESQTRQMELVVQSLTDSIEFSLDEYTDRLDSAARKVAEDHNLRPGLARSDTIRDIWIEDSEGNITYSCYGVTASCDVLLTQADDISYWQYHSGDTHYLVMKKQAGERAVCLVVNSTALYQQLVSDIRVGTNGYVMIKNDSDLIVMHPEPAQWGIEVLSGRQTLYANRKNLDLSSLSGLLRTQREEDSGVLDYYSYWWTDPDLPRVHKKIGRAHV